MGSHESGATQISENAADGIGARASDRVESLPLLKILCQLTAGAQRRLVFSEYFRLQLGEMIGNRLLINPLGDFLVSGLFDH
jgi:hypothetical protein